MFCVHTCSNFSDISANEQNAWIIQYLCTHCQMNEDSQDKDTKGVQYIITGKSVCQSVWLGVLGLSLSRFYRLRKEFEATGTASINTKRPRSRASKTMEAVAWMEDYFERVGDKRPDKDGIFLPTCLTETKIFEIMVDELYNGNKTLKFYLLFTIQQDFQYRIQESYNSKGEFL